MPSSNPTSNTAARDQQRREQQQRDRQLLERLQQGDGTAWQEITARFMPRLRALARRRRAPDGDETCTDDLLTDLVDHWLRGTRPMPLHLDAYIAQSARYCHERRRTREQYDQRQLDRAGDDGSDEDTSVAGLSAFTVRASTGAPYVLDERNGDADNAATGPELIERVMKQLVRALSAAEMALVGQRAEGISLAELAERQGVRTNVFVKRRQRAEARARRIAQTEIDSWPARDRARWYAQWRSDTLSHHPANTLQRRLPETNQE